MDDGVLLSVTVTREKTQNRFNASLLARLVRQVNLEAGSV
jgi:hypothetical protein